MGNKWGSMVLYAFLYSLLNFLKACPAQISFIYNYTLHFVKMSSDCKAQVFLWWLTWQILLCFGEFTLCKTMNRDKCFCRETQNECYNQDYYRMEK